MSTKDLVKQDINFMEYPIWMQDENRAEKAKDGYTWQDRNGYIYRAGYKPPVKTDFVFLLYLLLQSQQNGWKDEIFLTRYKILQECGIKRGTKWDKRLEDSLKRWEFMRVEFCGTFYDGKKYQTMHFGIIDAWEIEKKTKKLRIRFSPEYLLMVKNSDYFKYIDFNQVKALRSPLVIRLYEILVKNFHGRSTWMIDAMKLAKKIPINKKHPSHVIPKIKAAVNRINGYSDLEINLTVKRPERGKAIFIFEKVSEKIKQVVAASEFPTSPNEPINPLANDLTDELTKRGIARSETSKLIAAYQEKYSDGDLLNVLECFDYKNDKKEFKLIANKPGLLVTRIRSNDCETKGYISRTERQKAKQEKEEKEQQLQKFEKKHIEETLKVWNNLETTEAKIKDWLDRFDKMYDNIPNRADKTNKIIRDALEQSIRVEIEDKPNIPPSYLELGEWIQTM